MAKMDKKAPSMKDWEASKKDKAEDKKKGYKEGSKADKADEKKGRAAMRKKAKK